MKHWLTFTILLSSVSAAVFKDCIPVKGRFLSSATDITVSTNEIDTSVLIYNLLDVPKTNIPLIPSQQLIQNGTSEGFGICSTKAHDEGTCSTPGEFLLDVKSRNLHSSIMNKVITKGQPISFFAENEGFYCVIVHQEADSIKGLQVRATYYDDDLSFDQEQRYFNLLIIVMLSYFLAWRFDRYKNLIISKLRMVRSIPITMLGFSATIFVTSNTMQSMSFTSQVSDTEGIEAVFLNILFLILRIFIILGMCFSADSICEFAFEGDDTHFACGLLSTLLFYVLKAILTNIVIDFRCQLWGFSVLNDIFNFINPFVWFYWMFVFNRKIKYVESNCSDEIREFSKKLKLSRILVISIMVISKIYSILLFLYTNYYHGQVINYFYTGLNEFVKLPHDDFELDLWQKYYSFESCLWWKTLLINIHDLLPLIAIFILYLIWRNFYYRIINNEKFNKVNLVSVV